MRDRLAEWLQENEQLIVPDWIKLVRSRGGARDRQLTTRELKRQFFTDFYHAFVGAVKNDSLGPLAEVVERIAVSRVDEEYQLGDTLDIFFLLQELVWERLAQAHSPEATLSWMYLLKPTFDGCIRSLSHSFTRASRRLLSERLVQAEFMTRRLAIATEETDRALSRLRILYNVSRALSTTLDPKQIAAAVAENLISLPQLDRCAVWMVDRAAYELSVVVSQGIEGERLMGAYLSVDEDRSAIIRAFKTRQLQLASQVNASEEPLAPLFPQRSLLVVPLPGEERPVGVVSVDRLADGRPMETSVIEMVQSVADQAGMALHNTQLYQELVELNQHLDQRVQQRTEEMARLNRDLAKLNKKKSDFVAIAAHEFKTPLTLVQGYAEMLFESNVQEMPSDVVDRLISGIVKGAHRLRTIVENIIDVSLIDTEVLALSPRPTSLLNVVEWAYRDLSLDARERELEIEIRDLAVLPPIEADAPRLHQMFSNIIGNAVKYTPDGGRVEISARLLEAEGSRPAFVEVVVSDTGVGIDLEDQERIFDKFYRVDSPELHSTSKTRFMGAGPGLGLTIAKGIVEAHGGRIWVESPGHDPDGCPGSQFHILLPIRFAWKDFETREARIEAE
jgi:signal transduction histidine kinase